VTGLFFPQRVRLGLHQYGYSPAAVDKMVTANAEVKSGQAAVKVLKKLAGLAISPSHLQTLTTRIGEELRQQRDLLAAKHAAGELEPEVPQPPSLAVVGSDGGRILTRAEAAGRGVHEQAWKETKVGCLTSMSSTTSEVDPHPELPGCFAEPPYVDRLVRELKSVRLERATEVPAGDEQSAQGGEAAALHGPADISFQSPSQERCVPAAELASAADEGLAATDSLTAAEDLAAARWPESSDPLAVEQELDLEALLQRAESPPPKEPKRKQDWRPKRRVRTCVTGLCSSDEFGPKLAAEARRRRFYEARRRAFLGDGLPWNWTLQKRHFPDFTPILDFVHPLSYLYEAAHVVGGRGYWDVYLRWATACWQGRVREVLAELAAWQTAHPAPSEKLPDSDPRSIVGKTARYLSNNVSRMNYAEYRRQGLPVTSSMVESLIKELNYRVKGTEKFWNRPSGAEAILQIRTAALCDDRDRLSDWIMKRPGCAYYRPSTATRTASNRSQQDFTVAT
jgi:hypothetical protein